MYDGCLCDKTKLPLRPKLPRRTSRPTKCTKGDVEVRKIVERVEPRNGSLDSNAIVALFECIGFSAESQRARRLSRIQITLHCRRTTTTSSSTHDTTAVNRGTNCACAATHLSLSSGIHSSGLNYLLFPFHHGTQAQAFEQRRRESLIA
jgi:hypothetical protein